MPKEIYLHTNIIDFDEKSLRWFIQFAKKADKIVFHNLSVNLNLLIQVFLKRSIVRKSAWFIWGSDLYCHKGKYDSISNFIIEAMRTSIIRNIPIIASWITGDCRLAEKWYKTNAVNLPVAYYDAEMIEILYQQNRQSESKARTLKILPGNSATETNYHKEMIDLLSKWRMQNIKIYTPLSYGNTAYGNTIEEYGKKALSNKFLALRDFMSKKDYFSLLNEIDVIVFNHDRQQALGNIIALLFLRKKIYMRKDTTMWDDLVNRMGFHIFSIEDLYDEKIEDLCVMREDEKESNHIIAERMEKHL